MAKLVRVYPVITAEIFKMRTGSEPINDDLERVNCDKAGEPGHRYCGWNRIHGLPVFMVGSEEEN